MVHTFPSDFQKLAELEQETNKIRDILFFEGAHSTGQSNPFGQGGRRSNLGSEMGAKSWFPLESIITDIDEALVATGIFDKLDVQSIANVIVGPVGTLILKSIKNISDGKIFSVTPGVGRTVEITPGGGGGDDGKGIEVASTLTLTDKDMVFMQYFKDTDKVKIISGVGSGSGAGANTALSNLISQTAINSNLDPSAPGVRNIGDAVNFWNKIFLEAIRFPDSQALASGAEVTIGYDTIPSPSQLFINVPLADEIVLMVDGRKRLSVSEIDMKFFSGTDVEEFRWQADRMEFNNSDIFELGQINYNGFINIQSGSTSNSLSETAGRISNPLLRIKS